MMRIAGPASAEFGRDNHAKIYIHLIIAGKAQKALIIRTALLLLPLAD